jgi:glycosyltransferase involved in cell wall biosynthesis
MKILIVTPRIPYPPYRGDKVRVFNIVKNLSFNNQVYLLTVIRRRKEVEYVKFLKNLGIDVHYVYIPIVCSLANLVKNIFSKLPFQVAWFYSKKIGKKLNEIVETQNVDVVYYHMIRTAVYKNIKSPKRVLKVIDLVDAVSFYLSGFAKYVKNPIKKILIKWEAARVRAYERISEKFDLVLVSTERDERILKELSIKANFKVLPNGVSDNFLRAEPNFDEFDRDRILFTGNMPYWPNYDAALYFIKKIFPIVLSEIPFAKFYIVGQNPPIKLRKMQSENIIITGFVENLISEYLKSAVLVAPIRFGSGISNKVLEALSLGVPVVCTSLIADGFPDFVRKYLYIADEPEKFAELVIHIIRNPSIRIEFVHKARNELIKIFNWNNITNDLLKAFKTELSRIKI